MGWRRGGFRVVVQSSEGTASTTVGACTKEVSGHELRVDLMSRTEGFLVVGSMGVGPYKPGVIFPLVEVSGGWGVPPVPL